MLQDSIQIDYSNLGFDDAAESYHENATLQQEVAGRLIKSLDPWKDTLPPGPIIELGCGTGFLSKGLMQLFDDRELLFTDASKNMLNVCRQKLSTQQLNHAHFEQIDAVNIPVENPTYALSISNFVAQWFNDPAYTLAKWLNVTQPGGLLVAAFPGNESFPEWKTCCRELGLPFTANPLPDTEEMVVKLSSDATQVDYYEDTITQSFKNAADFFRHLKAVGAGTQLKGRHLSPREMNMLINHWNSKEDGDIKVSWHVVFLAVKKNFTG